jgi:hypothetical protein
VAVDDLEFPVAYLERLAIKLDVIEKPRAVPQYVDDRSGSAFTTADLESHAVADVQAATYLTFRSR